MRWLSFERNGQASFGRVVDGGVVDAGQRTGIPTLKAAIAQGLAGVAADAGDSADISLEEIPTSLPSPTPTKSSASASTTATTKRRRAAAAKTTPPSSFASPPHKWAISARCSGQANPPPSTSRAKSP